MIARGASRDESGMGVGHELFRREVLEARRVSEHGSVSLAQPVSVFVTAAILFAIPLCAGLALWFGTYERSESVPGVISFNKGVAAIAPSRAGVISEIKVKDGDSVRKGDLLFEIRAEEDAVGSSPVSDQIRDALISQDRQLQDQISFLRQAGVSDAERPQEEIVIQSSQLAELRARSESQQRLVDLARRELEAAATMHAKGFVSRRDLENREARLIERQQTLAQIDSERVAKLSTLSVLRRTAGNSFLQARATIAGLEAQRAQLRQQMASTSASANYAIRSPIDGFVTALEQREGQSVQPNQQLGVVRPANSQLFARLFIPGSAIGFVGVGQPVRVSVEAFPFERFGTIDGEITEVSGLPITRATGDGEAKPVFLATVRLNRDYIDAFGARRPLLAGMVVTGRVSTGRENLIEWMFRPLFALARR